jgi:ketosteroid isomerase-like protein
LSEGDVERMESLCTDAPEIVPLRAVLEGNRYEGPDAVRRFMADVDDVWSEVRVDIESFRIEGDTVIGRATWRGRGRESGLEIEQHVGGRFRIERGRIASFKAYVDPDEAG